MDKLEFLGVLESAGYNAVMDAGIPVVYGNIQKVKEVKDLAQKAGYTESFGIRQKSQNPES